MSDENKNPSPTPHSEGGLTAQAIIESIRTKAKKMHPCEPPCDSFGVCGECITVVDIVSGAQWALEAIEKPSLDSPKGLGVQPDIQEEIKHQLGRIEDFVAAQTCYGCEASEGVGGNECEVCSTLSLMDALRHNLDRLTLTDESLSKVSSPEPKTKDADLGPHEGWCDTQNKISDVCNCLASSYIDQIDRWKERYQKLSSSPSDFQVIEHLTDEVTRLREGLHWFADKVVGETSTGKILSVDHTPILRELLAPKKEGV